MENDLINRQAAIDVLHMDTSIIPYKKAREYADATILEIRKRLEKLPSVQPEITPDGTLNVSIDADIANVGRILLSQAGTQYGGLYYKDEQPEPKNKLISEIEGKTPEETYDFLVWLLNDYGMQFTDSRQAVIEWLGGE